MPGELPVGVCMRAYVCVCVFAHAIVYLFMSMQTYICEMYCTVPVQ